MVRETHSKALRLITDLHREDREKHSDDMTTIQKGQTPNQILNTAKIPVFYTLTKIHKPTMSSVTGRLIISGRDGQQKDKRFHALIDLRSVTHCSFSSSPQHVGLPANQKPFHDDRKSDLMAKACHIFCALWKIISSHLLRVFSFCNCSTGQHYLFLDSCVFFSTRLAIFSTHISKFRLVFLVATLPWYFFGNEHIFRKSPHIFLKVYLQLPALQPYCSYIALRQSRPLTDFCKP